MSEWKNENSTPFYKIQDFGNLPYLNYSNKKSEKQCENEE